MSADLVIAGYVRIAKLIRAVLTSEGIQAGIRHELPDMVSKIPDANPVKPLLRAIEHLDAYATAYRYPSPRGRVKPAPGPAELDQDIANIDRALAEIATQFQIDVSKSAGSAGKPHPIR